MLQYFKDIISLFSITQRLWVLTILCISTFFITFGSDIIEVLKPDPSQLNLVVKRQKNQIITLNTQLDTLSFKVDDLTQEVIDGQSQCTHKRIEREKEIIAQIDELENIIRNVRPHAMAMKRTNDIDGDSVLDNEDKCPTVMGGVRNNGCPDVNNEEILTTATIIKETPYDNTGLAISALRELKNRIKNNK